MGFGKHANWQHILDIRPGMAVGQVVGIEVPIPFQPSFASSRCGVSKHLAFFKALRRHLARVACECLEGESRQIRTLCSGVRKCPQDSFSFVAELRADPLWVPGDFHRL